MEGDAALPVSDPGTAPAQRSPGQPLFAHASEAELARILDFYAVRWAYEPHVFPILWTLDGAVVESFSPDFYLPDFDSYVELTTLRQPLVRKKNRKLRRLRELYPDIRIKLFYARDFRALMLKYGKFGLVDALSGTSGQVFPPGARIEDRIGPPVAPDALDLPDELDAESVSDPAAAGATPKGTDDAAVAGTASSLALRRSRRRRRRSRLAACSGLTGPDA